MVRGKLAEAVSLNPDGVHGRMAGVCPVRLKLSTTNCNFSRMNSETVPVATRVTHEVAEFIEAYAKQRGITKSRAVSELLSGAFGKDPPPKRGRGQRVNRDSHRSA